MLVRDRRDDRRLPIVRTSVRKSDHGPQLPHQCLSAVAITLVDNEDVADLQDASLGGLDPVTHARRQQDEHCIGRFCHLELGLAHPDSLHDHGVKTCRIECPQRLRCGGRKAAKVTPCRHRPDVHVAIESVFLHANPISEQRTARKGRTRIHGQYADPLTTGPQHANERGRRGRLADPRRPCQANDMGPAGVRRRAPS